MLQPLSCYIQVLSCTALPLLNEVYIYYSKKDVCVIVPYTQSHIHTSGTFTGYCKTIFGRDKYEATRVSVNGNNTCCVRPDKCTGVTLGSPIACLPSLFPIPPRGYTQRHHVQCWVPYEGRYVAIHNGDVP